MALSACYHEKWSSRFRSCLAREHFNDVSVKSALHRETKNCSKCTWHSHVKLYALTPLPSLTLPSLPIFLSILLSRLSMYVCILITLLLLDNKNYERNFVFIISSLRAGWVSSHVDLVRWTDMSAIILDERENLNNISKGFHSSKLSARRVWP